MSLDYGYIFSQIDKAKKKRKRWTQADTDAAYKKMQEDKKDKQPTISQRMYKKPEDRKPGEKPGTYTKILEGSGRNRGFGHVSEATNRKTRDRKGLSGVPRKQQIENKKRKEQEVYDKIQAMNENIATGLPTLQEIEVSEARTLAEAEQAKRERKIARAGKKIGIDAPQIKPPKKKKTKKVKPKVESKKPVIHTEELQDESEVDVIADSDDEDTDVGPITKDAELLKGKMRKLMDTITGKKIQRGVSAEGYKTFGTEEKPRPPKKQEYPIEENENDAFFRDRMEPKNIKTPEESNEAFLKGKAVWKSWLKVRKGESDVWDENEKKRKEIADEVKEDTAGDIDEQSIMDMLTDMLSNPSDAAGRTTKLDPDETRRAVFAASRGGRPKKGFKIGNSNTSISFVNSPFKKKKPKKAKFSKEEKKIGKSLWKSWLDKIEGGKCDNPKCDKKAEIRATVGNMNRRTGKRTDESYVDVCPDCAKMLYDTATNSGAKIFKIPKFDPEKLKAVLKKRVPIPRITWDENAVAMRKVEEEKAKKDKERKKLRDAGKASDRDEERKLKAGGKCDTCGAKATHRVGMVETDRKTGERTTYQEDMCPIDLILRN